MASSFFSRHHDADDAQNGQDAGTASRPDETRPIDLSTALDTWKRELTQVTSIDGEQAPRLTIGQAHPGGLSQLYTDHPTRLSLLIREPASHQRALERAMTIIESAQDLQARHGVGTVHLSIGQARWYDDGQAITSAVLLRPTSLEHNGDDVIIQLLSGTELDPVLRAALKKHGIQISAADIVERATTAHGFSASRALADLRTAASVLDRFELRDELIIGIFEHPATGLLRELDGTAVVASSDIIRALAGHEEAQTLTRAPLPEGNRLDRDPWKERGVGDLTPKQQDVVEAIAQGRSVFIDMPDGADDSTLIGAILADAGSNGRSVIHIAGSPSRTARAERRLRDLGIDEMAVRIDGASRTKRALAAKISYAITDTSAVSDQSQIDEMRSRLREVRQTLSSYTTYLHRPFKHFGISAFDALQVLTDLTSARPSPSTKVRLREDTLFAVAKDQGVKARELLHRACDLGIFNRATEHAAWKGIVINAPEQVNDVLSRVARLADESLPQLRVYMGAVAGEAGITPASTLVDWEHQLEMFEGVRAVLDVFQPQIFERSAADMVIATAPKQWRRDHGINIKRAERSRLIKKAQDFVRPGVHIDDLHKELLLVQERREVWRAHCEDDGWPTLPQRLDEIGALTASVREDLDRLNPYFSTAHPHMENMNIGELADLFDRLTADPEGAYELPKRVGVLKELNAMGLDGLTQDLRKRHVRRELIDAELDLAWWASILGLMLANEPRLGGFDPARLESTLQAGRELDREQVASLVPQAIDQLHRLRQQALATRPEQYETLTAALDGQISDIELLEKFPLARHLVPVVMTVPTLVPAIVKEGHKVDLLVLDEVDDLPLAELVPIIARARQVVVLADLDNATENGAAQRLSSVLPRLRMDVSGARLNDQVALLLARHGFDHTGVPVPYTSVNGPVTALWCDGTGMPAPGAAAVESTTPEVEALAELIISHAVEQPDRTLAVIALNSRHAQRIRQAVTKLRSDEPGLADFFSSASPEPFVVVDPSQAAGISRDRIIISVGFAKTPHGRVIHDFSELSTQRGANLMADVLRTVRADLTVVASIRASEIDRSRLNAVGAQMLFDLLEIAQGQSGVGSDGWPVLESEPDRLLVDLADRLYGMGLEVVPNVGIPGGMRIPLAIGHPDVPGRLLVAILTDDAEYVSEPSMRVRDRMRPALLEAQGWKVHTALSMAVFIDPGKEADTIVQLVLDAVDEIAGPVMAVVDPPQEAPHEEELPSIEDEFTGPIVVDENPELDDLLAQTSQARERSDELQTGMIEKIVIEEANVENRYERPAIARGLPLAAYSDDQLDEMAMWVRSDGVERTPEETAEELRLALGITRRGFQSDAVLGNVVRRTQPIDVMENRSGSDSESDAEQD
ncbi:hypothetical protein [Schaalia vaccimaxillae]|uniref:hypothetical protein n=1 Tax=Schaalia vaccimaxillae TaxID=183916 RepID=UPI0003B38414|nr:hypothetical protein [Schaalia vaccimaxillae]